MLLNREKIISKYNINNGINEKECSIECLVKNEGDYNIYLFVVEIFNEDNIDNIYNTITNNIAFEFQTELNKLIEKWNIYLIIVTEFDVKTDIKYRIEQDTFAVRKIVYDNFDKSKNKTNDYINKKLFDIDRTLSSLENEKSKNINEIDSLKEKINLTNEKYSIASKEDNPEIVYKKFIGEKYE